MIFQKNCINELLNCNIVSTLHFFQSKNVNLTFRNDRLQFKPVFN